MHHYVSVSRYVTAPYAPRQHPEALESQSLSRAFFLGSQSGDQSNNKILNGFKDIYWKLIQEHPELTARQVVDYYNPNALNPFALQQEDLLVWPVDKIIYGEWGRVKHEVRSPPQEVCKKGIHPSGCMASVSLPVRYELKDVSGIFQPSLISFA